MTLPFPSLEDIINTVQQSISYTVNTIYDSVRDALIEFYNWLMSSLEWLLNYIRGYIPYIIAIVLTWTATYKFATSENMSLTKRITGILLSPFIGLLGAGIIDGLLPRTVTLPRWTYPAILSVETIQETEAYISYMIRSTKTYLVEAEQPTEAQIYYV